jgi:hypothetical protein
VAARADLSPVAVTAYNKVCTTEISRTKTGHRDERAAPPSVRGAYPPLATEQPVYVSVAACSNSTAWNQDFAVVWSSLPMASVPA